MPRCKKHKITYHMYGNCPECLKEQPSPVSVVNELLPCPFCGKSDQLHYINVDVARLAYMQCMFCGATGAMWNITPGTDPKDLINEAQARRCWNVRLKG